MKTKLYIIIGIVIFIGVIGIILLVTIEPIDSRDMQDIFIHNEQGHLVEIVKLPIGINLDYISPFSESLTKAESTQLVVKIVIETYKHTELISDQTFDTNLVFINQETGERKIAFIISGETGKIVAHPDSSMIGKNYNDIFSQFEGLKDFQSFVASDGNASWYDYYGDCNELSEQVKKTAWVRTHDNNLFVSGYTIEPIEIVADGCGNFRP